MSEDGASEDAGSVDDSATTPASLGSLSDGEVEGSSLAVPQRVAIADEESGVLAQLQQYDSAEEEGESEEDEGGSPDQLDGTHRAETGPLLSSSLDFGTDSEAEEQAKHRFFERLERQANHGSQGQVLNGRERQSSTHQLPQRGLQSAGAVSADGILHGSMAAVASTDAPPPSRDNHTEANPATNGHVVPGPSQQLPQEDGSASAFNELGSAPVMPPTHQPSHLNPSAPAHPPRLNQSHLRASFPSTAHATPALEQLRPHPLQIGEAGAAGSRGSPVKSTPGSRARPTSTGSRRQGAPGGSGRLGAVQGGNLSSRVEELRAQLAEERAARQSVQQKMSDLKKEAERSEKRVREELEARVREAQRSCATLQQRVLELEGGNAKERVARGGAEVTLGGDELRLLRQEMAEQEGLIRGFQAENEKLVERLREVQVAHKGEREALQRECERLAGHLAQMENETHTQQSAADVGAHLQRILQLEAELEAVKSAAASREVELKFEIDRARQGRKELEARYAGVDPQKMAVEDHALAQAHQALALEREAHARDVAMLEDKLRWYAENQAIVTQQDETIKMQASRILDLEDQLRSTTSTTADGSKTRATAVAPAKAAARIRQLEKQVKALEASLAAQQADPNSLAALIQATRGSEEGSTVALRAEVEQLRAAKAGQDEDAAKSLRGLRQEHERIKRQYEERLRTLQAQLAERTAKRNERERAATAGRVKELEKQVEDLRGFYTKKVKELQRKVDDSARAGTKAGEEGGIGTPSKTPRSGGNGRSAGVGKELARAKERITQLEDVLARRDASLAALQSTAASANNRGGDVGSVEEVAALRSEVGQLRALNQRLQGQLHENGAREGIENARQAGPSALAQPELTVGTVGVHHESGGEREESILLQRRLAAAEMSRDLAQRQAVEAIEKAAVLRLQHQQSVAQLQEAHSARLAALQSPDPGDPSGPSVLQERVDALERAREGLEAEVAQLRRQLTRDPDHHRPHSTEVRLLERRLREMEETQKQRDVRWQRVVADTQRVLAEEAEEERAAWAAAMKTKTAEIARFRAELDDIITLATRAQLQRPAAGEA